MSTLLFDNVLGQAILLAFLFETLLAVFVVGGVGGVAFLVWLLVPSARGRLYRSGTTPRQRKRDRSLALLDNAFEEQLADFGRHPIVIDLVTERQL